jgi:hypothetical protein
LPPPDVEEGAPESCPSLRKRLYVRHALHTPIRILFVGASPCSRAALKIEKELASIAAALKNGTYSRSFEIPSPVTTASFIDLQNRLLKVKPNILHIGAHADDSQLILEDGSRGARPVSGDDLFKILKRFRSNLRCLVLNACKSRALAEKAATAVECAIGMTIPIQDDHAIRFSSRFYEALGSGSSVLTAFDLATGEIQKMSTPSGFPRLFACERRPSEIVFADPWHHSTYGDRA